MFKYLFSMLIACTALIDSDLKAMDHKAVPQYLEVMIHSEIYWDNDSNYRTVLKLENEINLIIDGWIIEYKDLDFDDLYDVQVEEYEEFIIVALPDNNGDFSKVRFEMTENGYYLAKLPQSIEPHFYSKVMQVVYKRIVFDPYSGDYIDEYLFELSDGSAWIIDASIYRWMNLRIDEMDYVEVIHSDKNLHESWETYMLIWDSDDDYQPFKVVRFERISERMKIYFSQP